MKLDQVIELAALRAFPDCYRRALAILDDEPCDVEQLAERMNTGVNNAYKTLVKLRQWRVVCVVEYRRMNPDDLCHTRRIWGIGSTNVRKPKPLSTAVRSARRDAKKRMSNGMPPTPWQEQLLRMQHGHAHS